MALSANGPWTFGIEDCKVAAWVGDGTYGTAVDVPGIKNITIEAETTNGEQDGDDMLVAVASKVRAGNVTITKARLSFEVLNIMLNQPIQSSSSHKAMKITSRKTRYFGLIARIDEAEGDGDVHIFVPKVKLLTGLTFNFAFGEFTSPEMTAKALLDSNYADDDDYPCLFYPIWHEDRQPVVIPPANI